MAAETEKPPEGYGARSGHGPALAGDVPRGGSPAGGLGGGDPAGGFAPPPLFLERMQRLKTAVACGTPDRVPVCLMMDSFAAVTAGVRMSEYSADVNRGGAAALATMEKLGDVDAIQFPVNLPKLLGMIWLTPVRIAGRDLAEDSLWQLDEQVRIRLEDYDRILEMGWTPWLGEYIGKYLQEEAAAAQVVVEAGPRWAAEFMKKGYVAFIASNVTHPFEQLSGGRSVKEFMLDLFQRGSKVVAVMEKIMEERRTETRQMVRHIGPYGYQVGSWRSSPEFLSPRLWDRFVWPYLKELVEIVAEEGGTPVLHFDANWDREIERLKELPAGRCILTTDGRTDVFRASRVLAGHMCIMGDVPPTLLTLGTVEQVRSYCRRLLTEIGPSGYIMAAGCTIPKDARLENVQAMVDSVKELGT